MSLLYKRDGSPNFYVVKTRESTGTHNRKLAEEYARKALTAHWRADALGETTHTWSDLVGVWGDHMQAKRTSSIDAVVITEFGASVGVDTPIKDITSEAIRQYGHSELTRKSAHTANRKLQVVRAMLRRAYENDWIVRVPKVRLYPITKKEVKPLTMEQFESVVAFLKPTAQLIARFALATGLRQSNVVYLQWDWLSPCGGFCIVPAVHTKTARTYKVPLSQDAKTILALASTAQSKVGPVFLNENGVTVPHMKHDWIAARNKAGINARFHDLRHTWASRHVQNGTPDRVLQQFGGWASPTMLNTYAHLSQDYLQQYADNATKVK